MNLPRNKINNINDNKLRMFRLSRRAAVSNCKKADLRPVYMLPVSELARLMRSRHVKKSIGTFFFYVNEKAG